MKNKKKGGEKMIFNKKQKEIDSLNARCVELAEMLKEAKEEVKIQKHNNELIVLENEKIKKEKEILVITMKRINLLMTCNQYENSQAIKNKIVELTRDQIC